MPTAAAPPPTNSFAIAKSRRLSNVRNCRFEIAQKLDDVLDAWSVLYEAYRRAGYIGSNNQQLHTVPQALGPQTLVMLGRSEQRLISTISAIGDNPLGLPLDTVYPTELNHMRQRGGKLLEIGLFGDRRNIATEADRAFTSIFELMRYTLFFGLHTGVTDFLCGIPPRRVKLYRRIFGFRPVGEVKSYSTVEDNPVVLMHAETAHILAHPTKHRAVEQFLNHPLPAETFARRYRFDKASVEASPLAAFSGPKQYSLPEARPAINKHVARATASQPSLHPAPRQAAAYV